MRSGIRIEPALMLRLVVAVGLLAISSHASGQYISDGTFNPGNYAVVSVYGSGGFVQETSGGNPGDFMSVSFSGQNIAGAVIDKATSFNPSTQGAILTLNLQADFEGTSFSGARFFAEQNGVLYIDVYSESNAGNWTTYMASPTASQFYYANGSGAGALNFSSTGAPIYLGLEFPKAPPRRLRRDLAWTISRCRSVRPQGRSRLRRSRRVGCSWWRALACLPLEGEKKGTGIYSCSHRCRIGFSLTVIID